MVHRETFFDKLKAEINQVLQATNQEQLYYPYLRLIQLICGLSALLTVTGLGPLWITGMGDLISLLRILVNVVIINTLIFFLAELALRKIRNKEFMGIALGLGLSIIHIPSSYFLVGALGLFALLNPAFQRAYYENCPQEFVKFLEKFDLSYKKKN